MLISTAKHNRIVAEKDAEIAERDLVIAQADYHMKNADEARDYWKGCVTEWRDACLAAEARLAPFTTPRARDDKGRFIKDTVAWPA